VLELLATELLKHLLRPHMQSEASEGWSVASGQ